MLDARPAVEEPAEYWRDAFYFLNGMRHPGMAGPLPIGLSEIEAYCRIAAVPPAEWMEFAKMIRTLDQVWMNLLEDKRSRKA